MASKLLLVIVLAIIIIGLAVAGIAIKMFVKKGGEFKKSCGSIDPATGKKVSCTCGKPEEEQCHNKKKKKQESVS
ncbi:MAG: hypothetical protein ACEPOV_03845 [Hyphomicrobiales bacterium]